MVLHSATTDIWEIRRLFRTQDLDRSCAVLHISCIINVSTRETFGSILLTVTECIWSCWILKAHKICPWSWLRCMKFSVWCRRTGANMTFQNPVIHCSFVEKQSIFFLKLMSCHILEPRKKPHDQFLLFYSSSNIYKLDIRHFAWPTKNPIDRSGTTWLNKIWIDTIVSFLACNPKTISW